MKLVCLDLEGVLVPEIWIAFSESVKIPELRRTTRDEPDYDTLMAFRLDILSRNNFTLSDIQKVIADISPLDGAFEFMQELRAKTQLVILSDTFEQFANPLMRQLAWPTLLCNSLTVSDGGKITGYTLRQKNGKREVVRALKSCNVEVFAAGDSFNDLAMIEEADSGCLFRAPDTIRASHKYIPAADTYAQMMSHIDKFLQQ